MDKLNQMMQSDFARYKASSDAGHLRRETRLEPTISKVDAFLVEKPITLGIIIGPIIVAAVIVAIVLAIFL